MSTLPAPDASAAGAFLAGAKSAWTSVFVYVLFGTYIGIGALAHDFGFSVWWLTISTVVVWAAPAQVILISMLGTGSSLVEIAIAVSLSGIRLFPMAVALLPLMRTPQTPQWHLALPAHFTAISMWVESLRLLPQMPIGQRVAFCNGLSFGFMSSAITAGFLGFYLAAGLPMLLAAALLFLTPMSFLISVARNSRAMIERLAFGLGLVVAPVLALAQVGLDLMWTGILGGTLAYAVHRLREALR